MTGLGSNQTVFQLIPPDPASAMAPKTQAKRINACILPVKVLPKTIVVNAPTAPSSLH